MRLTFRYVPAVPTTLACQLVGYFDTDPNDKPDDISNVDALIRQAVAHSGAQQWNFIAPHTVSLPQRSDDQLYYTGRTDNNERFNLQGKFFLVQVTNPISFEGVALPADLESGSLYVDWTCKFQVDQIDSDAVGSGEEPTFIPAPDAKVATRPEGYIQPPSKAALDQILTLSGLKSNSLYAVTLSFSVSTTTPPPAGSSTFFELLPLKYDATFNNQLRVVGGAGRVSGYVGSSTQGSYPSSWVVGAFNSFANPGGVLFCRTGPNGTLSVGVDSDAGLERFLSLTQSAGFTIQRILV